MEHHSNYLLPPLIEMETQIQMDPDKLDLNTIVETQHKLYSIISQLNVIRNSRAPVNKLVPDVVHNIFAYAVGHNPGDFYYTSTKTLLAISRVCQHWRKFALEWPTLWRHIYLGDSPQIIQLLLRRSKDIPLELYVKSFENSTRAKLKALANLILPRLRDVNLELRPSELVKISYAFRNSPGLQPFQLQHLKVSIEELYYDNLPIHSLTDLIRLDMSCLQSLDLRDIGLPRLELPRNNILTRFIFYSDQPPALSRLLVFLSRCSLLRHFELTIHSRTSETKWPVGPTESTISRLDFPKLARLIFKNFNQNMMEPDMSCFNYMRELSAHIGTMGLLSYFSLQYNFEYGDDMTTTILTPSNFFGLVPQETFGHFSNQNHLSIFLDTIHRRFHISSAHKRHSSSSLDLSGPLFSGVGLELFHRSLFELIHVMPKITHLKLAGNALKTLISWNLDFNHAFPCLETLELLISQMDEGLNLLPKNLTKCKRLDLKFGNVTPQVLLDVVSEAGVDVLDLDLLGWSEIRFPDLGEVISTLRQTGVVVRTPNLTSDTKVNNTT